MYRASKKTTKSFKKEVFELVGNEYYVLGEYVDNKIKIKLKHNTCGNIFEMTPTAFLDGGQRCPKEKGIRSNKKRNQNMPNEKNKQINDICEKEGYELIKGYVLSNINLILKHKKCGNVFKIKPYHFISNGVRCTCETESKGERAIREWLSENNIDYIDQYRFDNCKGEEKRLCLVEFDGLQHFTPKFGIENFNDTKRNDLIKNNYCTDNKIPLIRIKYNRSCKYEAFKNKIIYELKNKLDNINMTIPSKASEETPRMCND